MRQKMVGLSMDLDRLTPLPLLDIDPQRALPDQEWKKTRPSFVCIEEKIFEKESEM
jgi:hypothetical protein